MQSTRPMLRAGRLGWLVALILLIGIATSTSSRGESKPANTDMGPKASQKVKLTEVNIQGQFDPKGEKYQYLFGIGATIDKARSKKDATSLAMASMLLFQAEKQSGKKSTSVTALGLLEEATKLAEKQKNGTALKTISEVWGDQSFGPGDAAKAKALSDKAKVFAAEAGSAQRGSCRLVIKNKTSHTVDVYADDAYLGTIDPYDTRFVYVTNGYTELSGHATCHDLDWGPSYYTLGGEFTWSLTP